MRMRHTKTSDVIERLENALESEDLAIREIDVWDSYAQDGVSVDLELIDTSK